MTFGECCKTFCFDVSLYFKVYRAILGKKLLFDIYETFYLEE